MKFIEIARGILQPISNEESVVLERVKGSENQICLRKSLNEREQEIARQLCQRGVLTRLQSQGHIYYGYQELKT